MTLLYKMSSSSPQITRPNMKTHSSWNALRLPSVVSEGNSSNLSYSPGMISSHSQKSKTISETLIKVDDECTEVRTNTIYIPLYIEKGYLIDSFFQNASSVLKTIIPPRNINVPLKDEQLENKRQALLKKFKDLNLPLDFIDSISEAIHNIKRCRENIKKMDKLIAIIILEQARKNNFANHDQISNEVELKICKIIEEEICGKIFKKDKLVISELMKLANEYFQKPIDEEILNQTQFRYILQKMISSVKKVLEVLDESAFYIFQNIDLKVKVKSQKQITEWKQDREFQCSDYFDFFVIRNWIIDNIQKGFGNMPEIIEYNNFYNKSMLMPSVFYDFFVFNDIEYRKDNIDTSFHQASTNINKHNIHEFKCFNIENQEITYSIKQEGKTYRFNHDGEKEQVFLNIKFKINNKDGENDLQICSMNERNTKFQNVVHYHKKTMGNVSNGFWITFDDSNDRYYFKELYCLSDNFETMHNKRLRYLKNDEKQYIQYGTTVISAREGLKIERKLADHTHANNNVYIKHAGKPYQESPEQAEYYHINEYVELSGYFLLEYFDMIPKVNSFKSKNYHKPIIYVKGIDEMQYRLIQDPQETPKRFDFCNIFDDLYSVLISSVPVQMLRIIQVIFLIDDFHEGNLAISTIKKTFRNRTFEYIRSIQAIDIWPTYSLLSAEYLFTRQDISQDTSRVSFDERIMHTIDLCSKDYCLTNDSIKVNSRNDPEIMNFYDFKKGRLQSMISSLCTDAPETKDRSAIRITITYFAMIDLFDDFYFKNHESIENVVNLESNICEEISKYLLTHTYEKSQNVIGKLPDSFPSGGVEMTREQHLVDYWNRYVYNVATVTNKLLQIISTDIWKYDIIDNEFAFLLQMDLSNNTIIATKLGFAEFCSYFNTDSMTAIGAIFLGEDIPAFKNVQEELMAKAKTKIINLLDLSIRSQMNEGKAIVFAFRSPVKFDIAIYRFANGKKYMNGEKIIPNFYFCCK